VSGEDATLPEAVRALLDRPCCDGTGDCPVNRQSVRALAAAIEDGDPPLWLDDGAATLRAPVAMLSTWTRPELWSPAGTQPALALHHHVKALLGYPFALVSAIEAEYHEPLHAGDRVSQQQCLRGVSAEKPNRLGNGRYWTIEVRYTRQDGALAGIERFTCFGYRRDPA
jgi:hypothetical protein